jgi:type II secretion system protein G
MRIRMKLLAAGILLASAACSQQPPESTRRVFADAEKAVQVKVGEEFGLALSYNPTVSPDYRMELQSPLPDSLALVTTDYRSSDPGSRKTGVGGTRTWFLKGVRAGEGKVAFACAAHRRDGPGAPADVQFTVMVAGPPESQPPAPTPPPPDAARTDPAEAKRLRLAELLREIFKARKEPQESRSPARQDELKKLGAEAMAIARELAGDDEKKQEALAEEVAKKYLPDQYLEMQVMQVKAHLANIAMALERYYLDEARYPTTEQGLRVLADKTSARGPYLATDVPKDPWGRDYLYRCPGTQDARPFDLKSLGPDGKEGTPDDVEK